jgi:predicted nucleic acid-binding protein
MIEIMIYSYLASPKNMHKIFLDTNILLDIFLERPYMLASTCSIFDAIEKGICQAYISDISLVNISYIAKKYRPESFISEYI